MALQTKARRAGDAELRDGAKERYLAEFAGNLAGVMEPDRRCVDKKQQPRKYHLTPANAGMFCEVDVTTTTTPTATESATRYLRRREAGEYLKRTYGFGACSTLAKIACVSNYGPKFRKVGRMVLYTVEDLDAWARARIGEAQRSTSDTKAA